MLNIKTIFNQLCTAGVQHLPGGSFQKKISITINEMSLAIAIINITAGIGAYFITHHLGLLWGVYAELGLTAIPIYLNHQGRYNAAALALYLILCAATFFFCCLLGRLAEIDLMTVVLIGFAGFVFTQRGTRISAYFAAVLVFVGVNLNQQLRFIQPLELGVTMDRLLFWTASLVVIFLVIAIFYWYGRINDTLRKRAELESKNKNKLITSATHEIKDSFKAMFAIIGLLYKIEKPHGIKGFKEAVNDLRAACKNANNIVENLFEYEKCLAGIEPVVLDQLVDIRLVTNSIMEAYRSPADERDVALRVSISELIPYHIVCDETKVRLIINNLLHNAIKFTRNYSTVLVDITVYQRQITLSVKDDGYGIADDIKERIFEPFVNKSSHGLGIGLFIVRKLILAMNGSIKIVNNDTRGTTVSVTWPLPGHDAYPNAAMALQ